MVKRDFWIERIYKAWSKRSIIWLAGVRRSGKTSLCKSIDNIVYFDCELLETRVQLAHSTSFLESVKGKRIAIDEIHRLENPSELLKIAADYYPDTKILATGSSTLDATKKFSDSLTGRKLEIYLTPMLLGEGFLFGNTSIEHRFLYGGIPPFFLSKELPIIEFQEWVQSYWAKDIQELFRIEKRASFLKFTELLLAHSGHMFEASRFAAACEVSRSTIANYLNALEITLIVHIIRPFSGYKAAEIKVAPKVYGFDTGFVCYMKNWKQLRPEDYGFLWEHIVLNELKAHFQYDKINYWRDKAGHEIDFILSKNRDKVPTAIECKWTFGTFNPENLRAFRKYHPGTQAGSKNYVVVSDIKGSFERKYDDILVTFVSLEQLIAMLKEQG